MTRKTSLLALLLLAACGGTSPGRGSGTLYLDVLARSDGTGDGSWIAITVREGSESGTIVTGAQVQVTDGDGTERIVPWEGLQIGGLVAGSYATRLPWSPPFRIDVERGDDWLTARLDAPGITRISEPLPGATYRIADGEPLMVRWDDEAGNRADEVRLELKKAGWDITLSDDKGRYEISADRFQPEDKEELEVLRTSRVGLEGGAPGSVFEAWTRHRIEFSVE